MAYPPYYNYGPAQQIYGPGPGYPIYAPNANPLYAPAAYNPPPQPFIPPNPMLETSPDKSYKNRPSRSHRAATTPLPLKSALKKTTAGPGATPAPAVLPLSEPTVDRPRKHSKPRKDKVVAHTPQPAAIEPSDTAESYHMFVTFKGDSELLLENTLDNARKDIEEAVLKLWRQGLESSQFRASNWTIRFKNAPWNMQGANVSDAWELVVALFTLFARRGFSFIASTKCTTTQPRLVFQATSIDTQSRFFLAYMSRGGRRVTLIDPPAHIMAQFGSKLRSSIDEVDVNYESELVIAEIGGTAVKPSFFLMKVLKALMDLRFELNATVPMARGGPLGMGSRRELLVFKGIIVD